ncbi:hypothetical protein IH982_03440 [Patescibacteria group bacterium]|nr:hypothetical protein [Patescibacteria group bacterium]
MQKQVLIIGAILLVIVIGGIFLLVNQTETKSRLGEPEYSTTPTQWSQAEDYKIEETPTGTVVANEKAGFSFKVPEGWSVEGEEGITVGEYALVILSSEAEFEEDQYGNKTTFLRGCAISLETLYQKDEVVSVKNLIDTYNEKPEAKPEDESIIIVDNQSALRAIFVPEDLEILEKIGEFIQIRVPISEETLIGFGIRMKPEYRSDCIAEFDSFISSFSIN